MKTIKNIYGRVLLLLAMLTLGSLAHAVPTPYLVVPSTGQLTNAPTMYQSKSFSLFIDPARTNWIGWSGLDHVVNFNGGNTIEGGLSPNFGTDDYFTLTITDPKGHSSSAYTMDQNDKGGNSTGQQAIIFGNNAPTVYRANIVGQVKTFTETGIANSFLGGNLAGLYTFKFDFFNAWNIYSGHGNIYLLVDTFVPEPTTLVLMSIGLAGLVAARRRNQRGAERATTA